MSCTSLLLLLFWLPFICCQCFDCPPATSPTSPLPPSSAPPCAEHPISFFLLRSAIIFILKCRSAGNASYFQQGQPRSQPQLRLRLWTRLLRLVILRPFFALRPKATRRNDAPAAGYTRPAPSWLPCRPGSRHFGGFGHFINVSATDFCKVNFFAFVVFPFLSLSLTHSLSLSPTWPASDCECVTFVQGRSAVCVECEGGRKYIKMQTQLILRELN